MKILVRLAVVTFLSFGVISCTDAQSSSGATAEKEEQGTVSKDVDVKTFKSFVDKNDGTILDVRTVREIVSGKIKGAVHIDYYAADFMSQVCTQFCVFLQSFPGSDPSRVGESSSALHLCIVNALY